MSKLRLFNDPKETLYGKAKPVQNNYKAGYLTFSGCDIVPVIAGLDANGNIKPVQIGDIATLTYSLHQDKMAVRTLGRRDPRGFTKGQNTVAGTMIFNVFDRQALWELTNENRNVSTNKTRPMSELPAFDIVLSFTNEYGQVAKLGIFGVEIIDESQNHSVEDTYLEATAQYVARRIEPLEPGTAIYNQAAFTSSHNLAAEPRGVTDAGGYYSGFETREA